MKKVRKGKKMLIIALIIIAIIVIATVIIVNIVNKNQKKTTPPAEQQQVILLPETTYSDMEVKNIQMEYLEQNDETSITMSIFNTTTKEVSNEHLDAILIDANENVIATTETFINELGVGEQYEITVIINGNLTSATKIKLMEK